MATKEQLITNISDLASEVRTDSISPSRMAGLLSNLLELVTANESALTTAVNNTNLELTKKPDLDANGRLSASILKGAIPEDVLTSSSVFRYVIRYCWQYALGDTYDNASYMYPVVTDRLNYELQRNGYFPEKDPDNPFWIHGCRLNAAQALKVMVDHWSPVSHGMSTFEILTHLPMFVYTGVDSAAKAFNLDMCHAHRSSLRNIVFIPGRIEYYNSIYTDYTDSKGAVVSGIDCNAAIPCIYPTSMYRAFDGASALQYIHGGIDCRFLTQSSIAYAFRGCVGLNKLRLFNIPDSVTDLDLTSCHNMWPVLLHQLTFWHAGKSFAYRPAASPELVVRVSSVWVENLTHSYGDENDNSLFRSTYSTLDYTSWRNTVYNKQIKVAIYENGEFFDWFIG
ncbi:MAG: hypothetical protein K2H86_09060 [Muribaculaceae bacterium]|nr:hypothetical protein [Muribaculaceae bacterium]